MGLTEKINDEIKASMKAREKERLETLRAIKAQLLLAKTAEGAADEISEDEGIKLLQRMVKQRKDSAEIYKTQGRTDLFEKEILEVSFIEPFLPKQLTDGELTAKINELISRVGATSIKDLGKVMGLATKELAGLAEGKLVAAKVKDLLAKL